MSIEKPKALPKPVKRIPQDIKKKTITPKPKVDQRDTPKTLGDPKLPKSNKKKKDTPLRADSYWSWNTLDQIHRDKKTGEIHHGFSFTLDADDLSKSGIISNSPVRDVEGAAHERVMAL